jgi:hypothetical protein
MKKQMHQTISAGDDIQINASGKYKIDDALYECEYSDDFESDSDEDGEEAPADDYELTQIMHNYE